MLSTEEKETLESYNKIAVGWTISLGENFWANEYNKFSSILPKGKILDLGCGSGRDNLWFMDRGYDYVGFDASEEMIKLSRILFREVLTVFGRLSL
jgi:SAM-dependent methyltransferase